MMKLLHISDTPRARFTYFDELIQRVHPDILVHTGDMADDVKVGRTPVREEYLEALDRILAILARSGAKETIICPGNNDLPDEIARRAPYARVVTPGTVITLGGIPVCLSHVPNDRFSPAQITFYGHGYTAETHCRRDNTPKEMFLNGCLTSHIVTLPEAAVEYIDLPELANVRQEIWKR